MGDISLKQIFSLTPAGSMGMPDHEIKAGKFDQPGMMDMGSMDMGNMQGMESMNNSADPPKMEMHGMHTPTAGAGDTSHDVGMPMQQHSFPTEGVHHGGHSMPIPLHTSRIGKKYSADFRFLAADVSASENLTVDGMDPSRPWPPYAKLRATKPTAFPKDKHAHEIRLTLDGDMERYVWFLNNKPLSESDSIHIRKGEVIRFIMVNRTMKIGRAHV